MTHLLKNLKPVFFRDAKGLPLQKIADSQDYKAPATIDDPATLVEGEAAAYRSGGVEDLGVGDGFDGELAEDDRRCFDRRPWQRSR